jgi:hypothetical protein
VVVFGEIAVDRGLQIDQRMKHAALQSPTGKPGKQPFDRVEPGRRSWGEVKCPTRVPSKPALTLGCLWLP